MRTSLRFAVLMLAVFSCALFRAQAQQVDPAVIALVQSHADAIAEAARQQGYNLTDAWTYSQAVCPVATDHVLLSYERVFDDGQVSRFSAVVSRTGPDAAVVALTHAGNRPFVKPWKNAHSYSVFNDLIDAEQHQGVIPRWQFSAMPWLGWSECYLHMMGEPSSRPEDFEASNTVVVPMPHPALMLQREGGANILFSTGGGKKGYSQWKLSFSPEGHLIRVDREQNPMQKIVIKPPLVDPRGPDPDLAVSPAPAAPQS